MDIYTSKHQQRTEDSREIRGLGKAVVFFLLCLVAVVFLTGCAGTLDNAVATCFALEGGPSYTKAEGVEKFSCERSILTTRVSR